MPIVVRMAAARAERLVDTQESLLGVVKSPTCGARRTLRAASSENLRATKAKERRPDMQGAHGATASIEDVKQLGDDELIATTQRLLRQERTLSARLLLHLAEVDARQLYRQHAYSSMFEYCVSALHLSEAEAYLRIGAARLCRRLPRVLRAFEAGELHLSALKLLGAR